MAGSEKIDFTFLYTLNLTKTFALNLEEFFSFWLSHMYQHKRNPIILKLLRNLVRNLRKKTPKIWANFGPISQIVEPEMDMIYQVTYEKKLSLISFHMFTINCELISKQLNQSNKLTIHY